MTIFRFRVWMDDYPEVMRTLELRDDQTFEDLHNAILKSMNFDNTQLASFYVCNDEGEKKVEITLIDMAMDEGDMVPIMSETPLKNYIEHVGEKLVFEYDFVMMWRFMIEVEAITKETKKGIAYPLLVYSEGDAPGQYEITDRLPLELTEEDVLFVEELKIKNQDMLLSAEDDEEEESWDEDANIWDDLDEPGRKGKAGLRDDDDF